MSAPLLVIQHDAIAHLGAARDGLGGVALDVRSVHTGMELPASVQGYAGLLVLGGPQTAYEDTGFPSRHHEIALLREAVATGLPTLGICLGAQLLALATGGSCHRLHAPECGWTSIELSPAAARDPLYSAYGGVRSAEVMSSHIDAVALPPEATLLATSAACVQGFRVGANAWGIQYHPEAEAGFAEVRRALLPGLWARGDELDDPQLEQQRQRHSSTAASGLFGRFAARCHPQLPEPRRAPAEQQVQPVG